MIKRIGIILLCLSTISCFATDDLSILELKFNAVDEPEWPGPKAFVMEVRKSGNNPCDFIKTLLSRPKENFTENYVFRILLISSHTNCSTNQKLVDEYLKHPSPVIKAQSITLANNLPVKDKLRLKEEITEINDHTDDLLLQERSKIFLSNISKQLNK